MLETLVVFSQSESIRSQILSMKYYITPPLQECHPHLSRDVPSKVNKIVYILRRIGIQHIILNSMKGY